MTPDEAAAGANFGQAGAMKRGRNPHWPYVPMIMWPGRLLGGEQQIRGVAFATREEAVAYAQTTIDGRRDLLRCKLADRRYRSLRAQYGLPSELDT